MKSICRKTQNLLALEGPSAFRGDAAMQQHVTECSDCFEVLESLARVGAGLSDLAVVDAPDDVVERLLARPELQRPSTSDRATPGRRSWWRPGPLAWSSAVATAVVLVAVVSVQMRDELPLASNSKRELAQPEIENLVALGYVGGTTDNEPADKRPISAPTPDEPAPLPSRRSVVEGESSSQTSKFSENFISDMPVPGRFYQNVQTIAPGVQDADGDGSPNVHGSRDRDFQALVGGVNTVDPNSIEEAEADGREKARRKADVGGKGKISRIEASYIAPIYPEHLAAAAVEARVLLQVVVHTDGTVGDVSVLECNRPNLGFEEAAVIAAKQWRYTPATQDGRPGDVFLTVPVEFVPPAGDQGSLRDDPDGARSAAREFLANRASLQNLSFRDATGYWSNSYMPGNSAIRMLQARLSRHDRSALQAFSPASLLLHDASRQTAQPFDVPRDSALAVYLHADRVGAPEEGRMLLQVGLRGTPRHGGRRPAMNLALVLDLDDEIPSDTAIAVRSLIEAFNRSKEPGDRFRLLVSGMPGGTIVEPREFRHGTLKVTLDRLFGAEGLPSLETLGVTDSVAAAIQAVAASDDPSAPLGTSQVLLVTSRSLGTDTDTLADLAHQGAVAGVPLSIVGVGPDVALPELDRIALSGQGSRRLLSKASAAPALVESELAAASRAVARAVRLRIRLAPGVRLIDVVGSERLDAVRAERVREAEKSIDLRLARNLGIGADRGEDEEGIQIVIPAFYAADSHVVLLDVVVPGGGHVADVTARFKDLVQLRNGVARASLSLDRQEKTAGPLERNVLKNFLAHGLAETLHQAGRALARGDSAQAEAMLAGSAALHRGLRHDVPGLDGDPDVAADIAMLDEYRDLLAGDAVSVAAQRAHLVDSLCYAARLKILPRPLEASS